MIEGFLPWKASSPPQREFRAPEGGENLFNIFPQNLRWPPLTLRLT
jgi:hypothetical protein